MKISNCHVYVPGDIVRLDTHRYIDSEYNPRWDGKFGRITGIVLSMRKSAELVFVAWENGRKNEYSINDLTIILKTSEEVNSEINNTPHLKLFKVFFTAPDLKDSLPIEFYSLNVKKAMEYMHYKYDKKTGFYTVWYKQYKVFQKGDFQPPTNVEEKHD